MAPGQSTPSSCARLSSSPWYGVGARLLVRLRERFADRYRADYPIAGAYTPTQFCIRGSKMAESAAIPPMAATANGATGKPGFWERLVAFAADLAAISLASSLLQLLDSSGLLTLLFVLVYFVYFWSGRGGGQTWGMRVMGLRVVRDDGSQLDLVRAFIRFLGLLVSCLAVFIGVIRVAFAPKKQGWHDKLAGSVVVADVPAVFSAHPVTLTIDPPTSPARFWAVPVIGIFVKVIALLPILIALVFVVFAVAIALLVLWIPVLLVGSYPAWGRQFITWTIRWSTQVNAFMYGLTDRYPVPSSAADHPVRLSIAMSPTSSRLWAIPFVGYIVKVVILIPAFVLLYLVQQASALALLILWAPVLFSGVYPAWGHRFLLGYLRWNARMDAYLSGLTDTYPRVWNWAQ